MHDSGWKSAWFWHFEEFWKLSRWQRRQYRYRWRTCLAFYTAMSSSNPWVSASTQRLLLRTSASLWLFGAVSSGRKDVCVRPGVQTLENCQIDDCEVAPDDKSRALSAINTHSAVKITGLQVFSVVKKMGPENMGQLFARTFKRQTS